MVMLYKVHIPDAERFVTRFGTGGQHLVTAYARRLASVKEAAFATEISEEMLAQGNGVTVLVDGAQAWSGQEQQRLARVFLDQVRKRGQVVHIVVAAHARLANWLMASCDEVVEVQVDRGEAGYVFHVRGQEITPSGGS